MTAPILGVIGLHAFGRVQGNGNLDPNAVNVAGVVRNGVGSYTVTLGTAIDPSTRFIALTIVANGGAPGASIILDTSGSTSDTEFTVSILSPAGAAQDSIFDFKVEAISVPS